MKKHNVEQLSDEWFELKKQYPLSASKAQAIGNNGKGLETLCWEVLSEKYSSADKEVYINKHLERGVELEPQARALYELETGNKVEEVGFITDDKLSKVGGASPDGLVGKSGNLEIKCFDDTKHFKIIVDKKKTGEFDVESQYVWQVQMQMLFTGRNWTDFVAYNPNYKESLIIKRIEADKDKQEKIKVGLKIGEKIINDIKKSYEN